jgi:heat-inducible transcriptional repressor
VVSDRALNVLRVIVQDYIQSSEPVASKAIAERPGFDVSAATIRNDMALLEEEELITAPHTSAGRVPTDKGYRVFVDTLTHHRPLSQAQRQAIQRFLDESIDLDDTLTRTVRLLSTLTNQVALIQYPTFGAARVRHVELLPVDDRRVMVILITDSGRVDQSVIDWGDVPNDAVVGEIRAAINEALLGKNLDEVPHILAGLPETVHPERKALFEQLSDGICRTLDAHRTTRLLMSGAANLVKTEADFSQSVYPVLEAIEEQVTVLKLFHEMQAESLDVGARIGNELGGPLSETSVVAGSYQANLSDAGVVGVLGPTRMDYPGNMAAVRAVARYLSGILGGTPSTEETPRER